MLKRLFSRRPERDSISSEKLNFSSVTAQVDDSPGWSSYTGRPHDYDPATVQENYADALEAWRKNPLAWRIVGITGDYLVGDGMQATSPHKRLNKFIQDFWYHPQNRMDLRLAGLCDELTRSGDLFVILFRNPQDGMSYIRFTTKDRIKRIETAPNDWETELAFVEYGDDRGAEQTWLGVAHPEAACAEAVMLHYSVNRPVGALLGESDLQTLLPWLMRYSRMLEDRVKLNWAVRSFLWLVTVPANKVRQKLEQYRSAPEAGSVIIKDESETWEVNAPQLNASDASKDLQAVRMMIDAGSGYPPHWRGEPGDANLATAVAMQAPTERRLARRQQYLVYVIQDILYHAYQRKAELGLAQPLRSTDYSKLFVMQLPDVSRADNEALARAALGITGAFANLAQMVGAGAHTGAPLPHTLARHAIRQAFHFAGCDLDEQEIETIMTEISDQPSAVSPEPT